MREQLPRYANSVSRLFCTRRKTVLAILTVTVAVFVVAGCSRQNRNKQGVRPRTLRDVPSARLAFQIAVDVEAPPAAGPTEEGNTLLPAIQNDFTTNRPDEALIRTVTSPDRQRVLVVYATSEDEPNEFRVDLYGIAGDFQRHITPVGLAVVFAPIAAWSPDGNFMAFIAYKSSAPQPAPSPLDEIIPNSIPVIPSVSPSPSPSPTLSPVPSVPSFNTEQIYICSRDGFDLKPLTTRAGLIYFFLAWAPDSHAVASMACKESEWRDRPLLPVGRPRLIGLDGKERLLDDALTDVLPVWSPDSSKVATAVDTDVRIYDTLTETPTQATIPLREPLLEASRAFDEKEKAKGKKSDESLPSSMTTQGDGPPISFNPVVNLEWTKPETLYLQTGYVRNFENEQRRTWMRWHLLRLSAQAALLN